MNRLLPLLIAVALSACSTPKTLTLMPTPVIYRDSVIDPFEHLAPPYRTPLTRVFYATNRAPLPAADGPGYGNRVDTALHLGTAKVRLGTADVDWEALHRYSLASDGLEQLPLLLQETSELSPLDSAATAGGELSTGQQAFVDAINAELAVALDKEIMLYVHGTKVNFYNAAVMTAEIDHFAGRDFVGVAFAWPSHQNILSYLLRTDVHRALDSAPALGELLAFLARHTRAEKINILAYSAGARVTSLALSDLRRAWPELDDVALRDRFRIGSVVFAAADVSVDRFLERLPDISEVADQVIVTVTDNDHALRAARLTMGGSYRAGSEQAEAAEEAFILDHQLSNVEIIDVSLRREVRGFDIDGHHYWYRHPWMSSDIIFLMRTDLPAPLRGLAPAEVEGLWYLSEDYPQRIQRAAQAALERQWGIHGSATRGRIHPGARPAR